MYIEFENLAIKFGVMDYSDFTGDGVLNVPEKYVNNFIEEYGDCDYAEMCVEQYQKVQDGEGDFEIRNTDFQIVFINWALDQDETINFEYYNSNVFWLFHDIQHALHDCGGGTIYVDGYIEAERHYQTIKIMKERGLLYLIDESFLRGIDEDFSERYKWDKNFKQDCFDIELAFELADFDESLIY